MNITQSEQLIKYSIIATALVGVCLMLSSSIYNNKNQCMNLANLDLIEIGQLDVSIHYEDINDLSLTELGQLDVFIDWCSDDKNNN